MGVMTKRSPHQGFILIDRNGKLRPNFVAGLEKKT